MKQQINSLAILCLISLFVISCKKSTETPSPIADFSYTGAGLAPATVHFTNTSVNANYYLWDFGDNTTSTAQNPTHNYVTGGVFTVRLTSTGSGGSNTVVKTINIQSPTSVKINSIEVVEMPFIDPSSGSGWDATSGPDVYVVLTDNLENVILTGTVHNNIQNSDLPLLWLPTPAYQITNFAATYKLFVYEKDSPDSDDFIGGYSFSFSGLTGYPTTRIIQTSGNPLKLRLNIQWE